MITTFLLNLLYGFLWLLFAFLPTSAGLPQAFLDSVLALGTYANTWSFIAPMDTVWTIVGLAVGFEFAIYSFRLLNWIVGKIRGSN